MVNNYERTVLKRLKNDRNIIYAAKVATKANGSASHWNIYVL